MSLCFVDLTIVFEWLLVMGLIGVDDYCY